MGAWLFLWEGGWRKEKRGEGGLEGNEDGAVGVGREGEGRRRRAGDYGKGEEKVGGKVEEA